MRLPAYYHFPATDTEREREREREREKGYVAWQEAQPTCLADDGFLYKSMSHEREDEGQRQGGHSGQVSEVIVATLLIVFSDVIVATLISRDSRHASLTPLARRKTYSRNAYSSNATPKCLVNRREVMTMSLSPPSLVSHKNLRRLQIVISATNV